MLLRVKLWLVKDLEINNECGKRSCKYIIAPRIYQAVLFCLLVDSSGPADSITSQYNLTSMFRRLIIQDRQTDRQMSMKCDS